MCRSQLIWSWHASDVVWCVRDGHSQSAIHGFLQRLKPDGVSRRLLAGQDRLLLVVVGLWQQSIPVNDEVVLGEPEYRARKASLDPLPNPSFSWSGSMNLAVDLQVSFPTKELEGDACGDGAKVGRQLVTIHFPQQFFGFLNRYSSYGRD